ncbi:glutathione peroxidase [Alkalibacterium pelagium]|uniref:Glutathione peroxidase n=1 Tax=Alkalibacterium pelagium TaxID=426702 RepID=A0A1H7LTC8_9LACT|nr:glutathione peroxidase [Alkalibacterium pelagium]GEN50961.1 glutathione peroxidase [Alkalibacterium pelagium]SEL02099.1 glutathione peroxidase [Alkalibacterium pelagium]
MDLYDIEVETIEGKKQTLDEYRDNWLIIVNTASKCGLVGQLEGLQSIYNAYKDKGVRVLGFPCDQFMNQEPLENDEIKEFCTMNYNVTFPLFKKIKVNGNDAHPLYKYLKEQTGGKMIKWNYTKFLIGPQESVIERFSPVSGPEKVEEELKKQLDR